MKIAILLLFLPNIYGYDYLKETPVKLLDVEQVASRFPASDSEYRISMENGQVYCKMHT